MTEENNNNTTPPNVIWNVTNNNISLFIDDKHFLIAQDHPAYNDVLEAIRNKDYEKVADLVDLRRRIKTLYQGDIEVCADETVKYKGELIDNAVIHQIFKRMENGLDPSPLLKFLERLLNNPSRNSVEQTWTFVERHNLIIDDDGYVILWKGVREDYKDCHTGTVCNRPPEDGERKILEMPRRNVDDNPSSHCSYGYHAGSKEYASSYGTRMVIVKVDPADIVSVPNDANGEKFRMCKYEVIGEISHPHYNNHVDEPFSSSYYNLDEPDEFEDEDY